MFKLKKIVKITFLLIFTQFIAYGQRDSLKFERKINRFNELTSYNTLKNDLNIIIISIEEKNDYKSLKEETIILNKHSEILSKYTLEANNQKFNYKFLQSIYKSLKLQENELKSVLKNTQMGLEKLNDQSKDLNKIVYKFSTKNKKILYTKLLRDDIETEISEIDKTLNNQLEKYIYIETKILQLQAICYEQQANIRSRLLKQNKLIDESNGINSKNAISFGKAIVETINIKKPIINHYLRHKTSTFIWIFGLFIIGFLFYKSYHRKENKQNNNKHNPSINVFNYFTVFFSFLFLFFNKAPLTIEEFILTLTSISLLISFIKIKSSRLKTFSWGLLTTAFVLQACYSIIITNFKYEFITYLFIHALFVLAIVGLEKYYRVVKSNSKTRILIYLFLTLETVSLILYIFNFVTLSQLITSGMIHSILAFILYLYCFRYIRAAIKSYKHYLREKLPHYFESEIENLTKLFLLVTRTIYIIIWLRILFHSFNLNFLLLNTFDYLLNYSFAINDHEFSVGWIIFVISTLLITYLISNLVTFYLDFYSNTYTKKNYGYKVLIKISLYFLGFYIILILSGFQIDKFTIVLSALGFGIGFGLQNIAGNITSGLMLLFEKNLKIDDKIEINGKKGLIKDIGGRSIRIYCEDGSDILIPSSDFFDQTVINWNLGDSKKRVEINLSFKIETDMTLLKKTINTILEKDEAINQRNKTEIHILNLDNKGIHVGVYFWFDNAEDENEKISNLLEKIKKAIEEKGIQFYTDK